MEKKVDLFMEKIRIERPNFIATNNSFERKCVYTALENINRTDDIKILCNRKKEWKEIYAHDNICKKHNKKLSGSCDLCDDPWCCGPYCEDCESQYVDYCAHGVNEGDYLYKSRICVGINLYYDETQKSIKKL